MRRPRPFLLPLLVLEVLCGSTGDGAEPGDDPNGIIANPGFESGASGWSNAEVGNCEYYAPVDGGSYAVSRSGDKATSQRTGITIRAGRSYVLTVWARSTYDDAHTEALRGPDTSYPPGNPARAVARVQLLAGDSTVAEASVDVSPVALTGAPARYSNDDGGNVWVDGGYRHAFSEHRFVQRLKDDPVRDPWKLAPDFEAYTEVQGGQGAIGPVIAGKRKYLYVTGFGRYTDIGLLEVKGRGDPDYAWAPPKSGARREVILSHFGDENPKAFDAHVCYDKDTKRLWMAWGGSRIYVSELSPKTGRLLSNPPKTEFSTHGKGTHTLAARWAGDEWTDDNEWFEGPAIYKHGGYWYLFASYGSLMNNYTIRMGRGRKPNGPFYDKDGVALTKRRRPRDRFGSSFLLGDDGDHLVPGHPHIWEENGRFYLGYDYRTKKALEGEEEPRDTFGIRRLYWVNGWPTIWKPITVTFRTRGSPGAVGKRLGISLRNVGEESSIAAFDLVNVVIE